MRVYLLFIFISCIYASLTAQSSEGIQVQSFPESHVLSSVYSVEAGGEHTFNTYLSPLSHKGSTFALSGSWGRAMGNSSLWDMQIDARGRFGLLYNPAHNASMNDIGLNLSWHAMRRLSPLPALTLYAGAGALFDAGMLYLPRNSNNPVAARAYLGATINGAIHYSLRLWNRTFRLLDEISIPSLGVFFSPQFGQSYYEIYLGDTSGLVRCGWWGNHFSLNNLVALEVPICDIRLRIGYRFEVMNSIASQINSRITTHSFVLGISTDWLNVTRRHE